MWLIGVEEKKERLISLLCQPPVCFLHDRGGPVDSVFLEHVVEIAMESLKEAVPACHGCAAGECRCPVSGSRKRLSQGAELWGRDIIPGYGPMVTHRHSGHQRHVRRQGPGRMAESTLEQHTFRRHRIDERAGRQRIPVAAQVIRPQRVQGNDHHVGFLHIWQIGPPQARVSPEGDVPTPGLGPTLNISHKAQCDLLVSKAGQVYSVVLPEAKISRALRGQGEYIVPSPLGIDYLYPEPGEAVAVQLVPLEKAHCKGQLGPLAQIQLEFKDAPGHGHQRVAILAVDISFYYGQRIVA